MAEKSNWWLYSRTLLAGSIVLSLVFLLAIPSQGLSRGLSTGFQYWLISMLTAVFALPFIMWADGCFEKRGRR